MALQGTLQDFALPEIFQLIGTQRKTGVLTLDNNREKVSLKFLEGQIVGAETTSVATEDRLGELLVRTGQISQDQLKQALALQKQTLRRLGHILIEQKAIDQDQLVEALRVQSSQVVYRLFRWRAGDYSFAASDSVEYDRNHCAPISSETVLMEGARMMDEWPLIERRIRSDQVILRMTEEGRAIDLDALHYEEESSELDFDLGFDRDLDGGESESEESAKEDKPEPPVSEEEHEVMLMIDGRRTVGAIRDASVMGEFDVYRVLADLVTRGLLEEAGFERPEESRAAAFASRLADWASRATVAIVALAALATLPGNGWTPWSVLERDPTTDQLRVYLSISRLETLERAIRVFHLQTGLAPPDLDSLASGGFVRPSELVDPWGRPYAFEVGRAGYRLEGLDATGEPSPELSISRRFTPVQQMLAGDDGSPSGP